MSLGLQTYTDDIAIVQYSSKIIWEAFLSHI